MSPIPDRAKERTLNDRIGAGTGRPTIALIGTRGMPAVAGGVESHCQHLSVELVKQGCQVIVFCRRPYVNPKRKYYHGVRLVTLPTIRQKHLEAILHTFIGVWAARVISPDILHIQAIGPALMTPLAKCLGLKVVMTSHGSNYKHLKWGPWARRLLKLGEYLGIRLSNAVITISAQIAREIKVNYGRRPVLIPNGVELIDSDDDQGIIARYGLTPGKYILAVGRLEPVKGFHDLIEAFKRLDVPQWKLVIVGDADHASGYSRQVKLASKLHDHIVTTGFLKGAPLHALYRQAGLFVMPSYYEGLPIVLLEALGHGVFSIAADIPATREVGLEARQRFKPGDIDALCRRLLDGMRHSREEHPGQKTAREIRALYNWQKAARDTLRVYQRTLD